MKWECVQGGWWKASVKGLPWPASCIATVRELDGLWHTYVTVGHLPGDSKHRTLALAKKAAERLYKQQIKKIGEKS